MMRAILALDISVKALGWAMGPPDGDPVFGIVALPNAGKEHGPTGVAFEEWLTGMLAVNDIACLVYEAPLVMHSRTNGDTQRKLVGLAFLAETIAKKRDVFCFEGNVSNLKKWFSGNGRAEKEDMMAVARRYGWQVRNGDEADACALWAQTAFEKGNAACKARFANGPLGARPLNWGRS